MIVAAVVAGALLGGCNRNAPPPPAGGQAALPPAAAPIGEVSYAPPAPEPVVSVYEDPPDSEPEPVETPSAPPPMLTDPPPPAASPDEVWTGGYWAWQGTWVWVHGRWLAPPQPGYLWFNPYYEHRGGHIVFIDGFWGAPGVVFQPPGASPGLALVTPLTGFAPGPAPIGPEGVIIPAPPGSVAGLVIAAFVSSAPAVVTSAPPAVAVGMQVRRVASVATPNPPSEDQVIIEAPAAAVATQEPFARTVPAQAHLAAALPPVVRMMAPPPPSARALPVYVPGRPIELPPPMLVRAEVPPELTRPRAAQSATAPQPPLATPFVPETARPEEAPAAMPPSPATPESPDERPAAPAAPAAVPATPAERAAVERAAAPPVRGSVDAQAEARRRTEAANAARKRAQAGHPP